MKAMQKGFTLIELMIVIAIIGILAALALPQYQDYTIRTKVGEGLALAAAAKVAVAEAYQATGNNSGLNNSSGYTFSATDYVSSINVSSNGNITISSANTGASSDPVLVLEPTLNANSPVNWTCTQSNGQARHVPAECR